MPNLFHLRRKLVKAWTLRGQPLWRRALAKGVAASVEHRHIVGHEAIGALIDVGANRGQFSLLAAALHPGLRIHAFEPLADCAATYRQVMAGVSGVTLHNVALGDSTGSAMINVSAKSDASSLLRMGRLDEIFPGSGIVRTETITVRRLDEVLTPGDLVGRVMMKIDVQGFEDRVIRGAEGLLDQIDLIYVEMCFVPLYEGQALFPEINRQLEQLGYRARRIGYASGSTVEPGCYADVLYQRTPH